MSEAANSEVVVPVSIENMSQAYERARERIAQIGTEELLHINMDVPSTATTVVGTLKDLRMLRDKLAAVAEPWQMEAVDQLETHAVALLHLHTQWTVATRPRDIVPELIQRATRLRELFIAHVTALALHGLLDDAPLRNLKGTTGHRNIAMDLAAVSSVLRVNWSAVNGKTPVQLTDLDEADKLALQIINAVGEREQAHAVIEQAALDRQRAFTLLRKTYDEVQRLVSYVRWKEGDMEDITPSLFQGRGKRRPRSEPPTEPSTPTAVPTTQVPATPSMEPAQHTFLSAPVGHPNSPPLVRTL